MPTKKQITEHYQKELAKMLSDSDIDRWVGKGHIIKYSDLADYSNINELLPNDKDFKIIILLNN